MILLAGFAFAGATLLQAQEEPAPAQPTAPSTGPAPAAAAESAPPSAAPPAPGTTQPATAPTSGSADRPVGSTPNRFEPTEKVRADFDVSFPVDI